VVVLFNTRGLFGGSVVSGGSFGSLEKINVCDALVISGPEASCSECTSSSLTKEQKIFRHKGKEVKSKGCGKGEAKLTSSNRQLSRKGQSP
jgi:hypothetical protein